MHEMELCLTTQAQNFATCAIEKATRAFKSEMATLRQALGKTMVALDSTNMFDNGGSLNDKEDAMVLN